ncbi:sensor histidine kinase [Halarcobacter ebronensis]|nr:HAMP domain-containing sensor histidine kinase [Halarcobacter ebronensis]QKF81532.1 two-component system sensor histidine kinase [Halarcobacter ebronensis]
MFKTVLNKLNDVFNNFNQTIGYVIFKKIFLGYLCIVIFISVYQSFVEIDESKKMVEKNMKMIEKQFSNELREPLLKKDFIKVNKILNSISNAEIISGIILTTKNKKIYFPVDRTHYSKENYDNYKFTIYESAYFSKAYLADVELYTNNHIATTRALNQIYRIIIYFVVFTLLFWILTIFYTNKYLTLPLKKLITGIRDFEKHDEEKSHIKLQLNNLMELSILADAFNKMSGKISEDIINLKQLTMIQGLQKKALENANRAKDDFLANMSHELKTPLNSINLISSIMKKNKNGKFDEKEVKNLEIINSCGNDLLFLINDVLDISKLEAGKLELYYETIETKKVMVEIKDMFEPQIIEKRLKFDFKYDESIENIFSDKQRIKQIIKNLISNSLKFLEKGEIRFYVENDNEFIKVTVSDDGIGIQEDKLNTIFDRFKQADESTTRKYGGTGLGLAICKELTELFNGKINIQSKFGTGTTVTVHFPKNLDNAKELKKESKPISEAKKESLDNTIFFGNDALIEEKEEIKKNILILNKDPINYMSLIIELNKNYSVQQSLGLSDFKSKLKSSDFALLIVDMECITKEQIDEYFLKREEKIVFVSKEEKKESSFLTITKPFDKEKTLKTLLKVMEE